MGLPGSFGARGPINFQGFVRNSFWKLTKLRLQMVTACYNSISKAISWAYRSGFQRHRFQYFDPEFVHFSSLSCWTLSCLATREAMSDRPGNWLVVGHVWQHCIQFVFVQEAYMDFHVASSILQLLNTICSAGPRAETIWSHTCRTQDILFDFVSFSNSKETLCWPVECNNNSQ